MDTPKRVWTQLASMPRERTGQFGIEYADGKLLLFGGGTASSDVKLDVIDEYDIHGDTWSPIKETLELETETKTVKLN